MRIAYITLKRSMGRVAFPLLLLIPALHLALTGPRASATWGWAGSAAAGVTILLAPAAAGVAAADSVVYRRNATAGGAAPANEPGWHAVRVLAVTAWVCLAHVLGVVAWWVWTAVRHGQGGVFDLRLVGTSLAVLLANVALGLWPVGCCRAR